MGGFSLITAAGLFLLTSKCSAWTVLSYGRSQLLQRRRGPAPLDAAPPRFGLDRRYFLGASSLMFLPSSSAFAATSNSADSTLIQNTAMELAEVAQHLDQLEEALAAVDSSAKLPRQVPLKSFQATEKLAKSVDTAKLVGEIEGSDGFMPAEDYLAVATEYAEHAGAARDLAKLAKLGRVGENGSEEVARGYAKRCVEELQATSALLMVLAASVK